METQAIRNTLAELITDLDKLRAKASALLEDIDNTTEAVRISRQGRWTKQDVARLWAEVKHLAGVRALFEITAERPDEIVVFTEVIQRSGLDSQQQRNEHARMSRIAADLFGEKRWPIDNWQGDYDPSSGKSEMRYRMDSVVARWWHEIK